MSILAKLTYEERYVFGRIVAESKIGGLRMDGNRFGLAERVLQNVGLIAVEELSGDDAGTWVLTLTDKGRSTSLQVETQ